MRFHILFASAAALVACGGSTAPLSAGAPDASSDVAIDHGGQVAPVNTAPSAPQARTPQRTASVGHPGSNLLSEDAGSGSSSSGGDTVDSGAGSDASTASSSFPCGGVMCTGAGQYCSVQMTSFGSNTTYNCMQAPFGCSSSVTCGCVMPMNPFDAGNGCSCATDGSGHVTLTCPY